ncbi:hypothetical protein B0H13DRAFT_1967290 [Mycena leptocephala]|nr:hypothetical protein B0H13DRAFT_1967290 [Mycena leptocephala]
MSKEDALPKKYTYAWTPDSESELSLPDFLKKYKPSMVQNDGTKPWIWVRGKAPAREDENTAEALDEGIGLLEKVSERVDIPARSSKKTGAKGKKEVREEAQAQATEEFKKIATKHGFVSGKWLSFAPADKVDAIWTSLATSVVSGPLAATCAFSVKHLICVYMPDVYDKDAVTEVMNMKFDSKSYLCLTDAPAPQVMKVLLRNHGLNLSGVKSNMYTALGIDSKHPSGLPSTTWQTKVLLPESESKVSSDAAKVKAKPQPKKKQAEDDPFASDDDEDGEEEERKAEVKAKKAPPKAAKRAKDDSDEDDEEERPKKKKTAAKK